VVESGRSNDVVERTASEGLITPGGSVVMVVQTVYLVKRPASHWTSGRASHVGPTKKEHERSCLLARPSAENSPWRHRATSSVPAFRWLAWGGAGRPWSGSRVANWASRRGVNWGEVSPTNRSSSSGRVPTGCGIATPHGVKSTHVLCFPIQGDNRMADRLTNHPAMFASRASFSRLGRPLRRRSSYRVRSRVLF
jgi:hypothetical protein